MPKISAATVAEHRSAQRAALIDAAKELIAETGVRTITPRSVGERAGLARSSFYEYFPSKDDLLAAIASQAFEEWNAEVEASLTTVPAGRERLRAYVEVTLRMTADGKHTLATGMQKVDLSPKSMEVIMQMHEAVEAPLRNLLAELDIDDPRAAAVLVQGLVTAGMRLVEHGADVDGTTAQLIAILDRGVG